MAPLVIEKRILTYANDNYQVIANKCKNASVKELEERMIEAEQWMSGSGLKVNIKRQNSWYFIDMIQAKQ